MKKIYIAGPMTGIPEYNFPAFNAAEGALMGYGVSPARNGVPIEAPREEHLRADIKLLAGCDGVLLLDGWQNSKGARLECFIADNLGMPTFSDVRVALEWAAS